MRDTALSADVVIVGAGFAGLTAARELTSRGVPVVVAEARDRVGGRVLNHPLGGGKVIDVGGQWTGPGQERIRALGEEMGVGSFPTYGEGQHIDYTDGQRAVYSGPLPDTNPAVLAEVVQAIMALDQLSQEVPTEAPWEAPLILVIRGAGAPVSLALAAMAPASSRQSTSLSTRRNSPAASKEAK